MFSLLKIISTLPNDTILNNSKSILEVNYDSKIGPTEIGADEKKCMGIIQRTWAKKESRKQLNF